LKDIRDDTAGSGTGLDRKAWDRIVSWTGAIVAVALILLGGFAVYGGMFGQRNVQERLEPQAIAFPPADGMTPEEVAEVGGFAARPVIDGSTAEAYSRYIGLHLQAINEGATYAETSTAAREEGLAPDIAAELQGKADTLFKGETLRSILLNAYGWWTVATIALWAGFVMLAAGGLLLILALLGFRHAGRAEQGTAPATS